MIYVASHLMFALAALVIASRQSRHGRLITILVFGFCTIISFARGNIGTDTLAYESLVNVYSLGNSWTGIEPGFIAYVRIAEMISNNTVLLTRGLSLIFGALLLVFCLRASRDELFVIVAYFAPNYFFQMSMNGLRIGIATAAFLCAVQLFRRGNKYHAIFYTALGIAFHVSLLFAFTIMAFIQIKASRAKSLLIPMSGLLLSVGLMIAAQGYLLDKFGDYTIIVSPGIFSGLSPVGRILIIVMSAIYLPIVVSEKKWLFFVLLVATALSYATSTISYAGLRFLEIIASVAPFLILLKIDRTNKINRRFWMGLALAGFLGGTNTLRSLFGSVNLGGAPFVPYHFLNDAIISRG